MNSFAVRIYDMDDRELPITWSPEAIADLDGIWDYYEEAAGIQTAENISKNISHRCEILGDHPFSGRDRNSIRLGLQSIVAEPFVVFYRVHNGSRPEIVRVIDGRRDIEAEFAE